MADGHPGLSPWFTRRQLPVIVQSEATECALACLAMIAGYHQYNIDLPSLRRRFSASSRGMNLAHMMRVAHALGMETRAVRVEIGDLRRVRTPCILHWNLNHFVVLKRLTQLEAEVHDPARGRILISLESLSQQFTGIVLEMAPGPDFSPKTERQHIGLRSLTGHVEGIGRVAVQVLGIAFALEVLALVLPFQIQWVVDQVLVTGDRSLLIWITLGFVFVLVLQTALNLARAWILTWLGASLSSQWLTNLVSHLLRLPLAFFGRREMGEVMSRFASVQYIQTTLTGGFAEVVLNGLTGSLAWAILCFYSVPLSMLVLLMLLIYGLLRTVAYRTQWAANEEQILYAARQQTQLMEAIRGVQAIKLANKEGERSARLAAIAAEAGARAMRNQRINQSFVALNQGLFGLQRVLLIALGGTLAVSGKFSAGMLIAFVNYADQFVARMGALVDKIVEFRMLRLHGERIADIALQEPETSLDGTYSGPEIRPYLTVSQLGFRYGPEDPWVFRDVSFSIEPGQSVAIIGPSGCGKSTLAKLIVGLLAPAEGSISIDGVDIHKFGLANYRQMIGTVMQDDHLFAGSIADNISFFDPDATLDAIVSAARMAHIHDEIVDMTMGYESLVGDMGASLSGGQRQRVILARAFYRKPRILVLDEATSHLDVDLERRINASVRDGSATRIIIAHRPETIASADRVIDLRDLMKPLQV